MSVVDYAKNTISPRCHAATNITGEKLNEE